MTYKEKYENLIKLYKTVPYTDVYGNWHTHHIYPKSIWPEHEKNALNLVQLPAIVHWYAHIILNKAYEELGHNEWANKLKSCESNIAEFINKDKDKKIRFSRRDEIIEYLEKRFLELDEDIINYYKENQSIRDQWCSFKFVCILGRCNNKFNVFVKRETSFPERAERKIMTLEDAKATADEIGVELVHKLTDKKAKEYNLTSIQGIRDVFNEVEELEKLANTDRRKYSPILVDLTKECFQRFSDYPDLPAVFDFGIADLL